MTALRILVVDDDVDSTRMLEVLLDMLGHEARSAHDGRSALVVAAEFAPDVALLDLTLPDMDGFALAERLRDIPGLERVALIAVTGWSEPETAARARAQGFRRLLVKPIEDDALAAALDEVPARQ